MECSLVTSVPQALPGTSYGHVIELTGIGKMSLAELTVHTAFNLTMIIMAVGTGVTVSGGGVPANGSTHP